MGAASVGRTDGHHLGEAELEEIRGQGLVHLLVDLVDDQDEGAPARAEHVGQFAVEGREASAAVDDEEQEIGAGDRGLSGDMGGFRKVGIGSVPDAARVDDLEGNGARLADPGKAIAGHARLIVDDRHAAAHQAVEEGGFAHVGAADNGDASHDFPEDWLATGRVCPPSCNRRTPSIM